MKSSSWRVIFCRRCDLFFFGSIRVVLGLFVFFYFKEFGFWKVICLRFLFVFVFVFRGRSKFLVGRRGWNRGFVFSVGVVGGGVVVFVLGGFLDAFVFFSVVRFR